MVVLGSEVASFVCVCLCTVLAVHSVWVRCAMLLVFLKFKVCGSYYHTHNRQESDPSAVDCPHCLDAFARQSFPSIVCVYVCVCATETNTSFSLVSPFIYPTTLCAR